jgi:hypothetical protein
MDGGSVIDGNHRRVDDKKSASIVAVGQWGNRNHGDSQQR